MELTNKQVLHSTTSDIAFSLPEFISRENLLSQIDSSFTAFTYILRQKNVFEAIEILKEKMRIEAIERAISTNYTLFQYKGYNEDGELVFFFHFLYDKKETDEDFSEYDIYVKNNKETEFVNKVFAEFDVEVSQTKIKIRRFYQRADGGLGISSNIYYRLEEMREFKKEYYPYIDVDEMFKQFLLSNENILIVIGEPGLGKSKMLNVYQRFLLENIDLIKKDNDDSESSGEILAFYLKNENLLASDEFWNEISEEIPDLVILDDIDYYLTHRTAEVNTNIDDQKNKFISNFLTTTDGLFSKTKRTKFLITSNLSTEDLDVALLRKGRMFDIIKLRPLTNTEAKNVWKTYDLDEDFDKHFKSEIIFPSDLGSKIKLIQEKKAKKKETKHSYLKEEGISILEKVKKRKHKEML
jgi:hypothetical protein